MAPAAIRRVHPLGKPSLVNKPMVAVRPLSSWWGFRARGIKTDRLLDVFANPPGRPGERRHSVLGLIVSLLIIGLTAGALARLVIPGRQDMSILMTIVLGVIGSFVGGFLGYLLFHKTGQDGFFPTRRRSSARSSARSSSC